MTRYNCEKITTFREVFDYIMYDWDDRYYLKKHNDGVFSLNKLYIGENFLQYKMDCHEIDKSLYDKVEKLYNLLTEEKT